MKIPDDILPEVYKTAKDVTNGKLSFKAGVGYLESNLKFNKTSAGYYLGDFRLMLSGRLFTRAMNAASIDFFLGGIYNEYPYLYFERAISSVRQHIEYFEGHRNINLNKLRNILTRYEAKMKSPLLITTLDHLMENISTLEESLAYGTSEEQYEAARLIQKGICFVAYQVGSEIRFVPSRVVGYTNNRVFLHNNEEVYGGDTNKALNNIFGFEAKANDKLEQSYLNYCLKLGIHSSPSGTSGNQRKYWEILLDREEPSNQLEFEKFPEGNVVARVHFHRERDPKVIKEAKRIFKIKHGRLFCEICGFDFKKSYGTMGKDFIEGHHTIAVKDMEPGHETKIEDIAMLCSNCHRMVHIKRPWLNMAMLKSILANIKIS